MKKSTYWLGIAIVGTVLGLSIQFASAWTPPSSPAPNGQVTAPVLTSGNQEIKGTLTVENLIVKKDDRTQQTQDATGHITLGDVERDTWPGGGAIDESGSVTFDKSGTYTICIYPKASGQSCDRLLSSMFNQIDVEIWGGGGGGGNSARGNSASSAFASFGFSVGGGGGGGGYSHTKVSVSPGDVLLVSVGYGGAGAGTNLLTASYASPPLTIGQNGGSSLVTHVIRLGGSIVKAAVGGGVGGRSIDNRYREDYWWCSGSANAGGAVTTAGSVTNTTGNVGQGCSGGCSTPEGNGCNTLIGSIGTTKAGGAAIAGIGGAFGKGGNGVYAFKTVPALRCGVLAWVNGPTCLFANEDGSCRQYEQIQAVQYTNLTPTATDYPTKYQSIFANPDLTGCTYTSQSSLQFNDPAGRGQDGGAIITW